jgi:uncharacterized protein RhaS with RHS repeats
MPSYQLDSTLQSTSPVALVVRCSDHRFQAAFNEFLNKDLALRSNYDLIVLAGGPQRLTLASGEVSWRTRYFDHGGHSGLSAHPNESPTHGPRELHRL